MKSDDTGPVRVLGFAGSLPSAEAPNSSWALVAGLAQAAFLEGTVRMVGQGRFVDIDP
jgi:hypothetical protein